LKKKKLPFVLPVSFTETVKEIEKLYALAKAYNNQEITSFLEEYQNTYNKYLNEAIINEAIKGKVTLEEVNRFHKEYVVPDFEEKLQKIMNS